MATYRKRLGKWRAEIARQGVRRSETFASKTEAMAWATRQEAEILGGAHGNVPNLTVAALLERYKRDVASKKKGRRWENVRLDALGRDRIAQVRLRSLDAPHASDWQQRRLEAVSESTVRRERNLLNNVFQMAVKEWRWLAKNPFDGIRRPKDGKHRKRIASPKELKLLEDRASSNMRRVIVWAVETGMRASEIAAISEVEGRVAFLQDSKNGEAREVPLSEAALEVWDGPFPLTANSISELFGRYCDELEIEGLTFHDLRHTAATRLAKKLNLLQLCKMFGWKDPRHALRYYNETAEQIAEKL